MDSQQEVDTKDTTQKVGFIPFPVDRKPLELLRNTEAYLRRPTVAKLVPILPPKLSQNLQTASSLADESWQELAEIDLDQISDREMHTARIRVGLSFVGFGALMVVVLLLYLNTIHPELNPFQQMGKYWYEYIWFVCLGVAGMFILGREAMRPREHLQHSDE